MQYDINAVTVLWNDRYNDRTVGWLLETCDVHRHLWTTADGMAVNSPIGIKPRHHFQT